jgi:hypothetical protein
MMPNELSTRRLIDIGVYLGLECGQQNPASTTVGLAVMEGGCPEQHSGAGLMSGKQL